MNSKKYTVFLGGTCGSNWRDDLIPQLEIDYYNPVVEDWTPEFMEEERLQRDKCDFCLYVITPEMEGVYSIAEVVEDSIKRPEKTIFCFTQPCLDEGAKHFTEGQIKSLDEVAGMVLMNGGKCFDNLRAVLCYLNNIVGTLSEKKEREKVRVLERLLDAATAIVDAKNLPFKRDRYGEADYSELWASIAILEKSITQYSEITDI